MRMIVPTLLALSAPITCAFAEDMDLADLRVSAGLLSNHFTGSSSTTVTDNSGSVVSSTNSGDGGRDADHNYRGTLGVMFGHLGVAGGFLIGADIGANQANFNEGASTGHATTPLADLFLGYGYAPTKFWDIELTVFGGGGRTYYSVSQNGNSSTSKDWEKYVEYGARLGSYWTLPTGLQIGLEVPYLVGRFNPDYTYTDNSHNSVDVTDNRKNSGFGVQAVVGIRF
jgi:hypothetical protein